MRIFAAAFLALGFIAPAFAADLPIRPDDRLTPGAVATTDVAKVCKRGYSASVRHTTAAMKREAYRKYGIDPKSGRFEVDYRVPLELGGADVQSNLWPNSLDTYAWNSLTKDRLENRLHSLVCAGRMRIEDAQGVFLGDWVAGYRRVFGVP